MTFSNINMDFSHGLNLATTLTNITRRSHFNLKGINCLNTLY